MTTTLTTRLIAIDVGPESSAYCFLEGGDIGTHAWVENAVMLEVIAASSSYSYTIVLESPQAQDRPLGKQLRDTIWWAGRFAERADACGCELVEAEERDVAFWLTGNRSANNPAILQSLKDAFGDKSEQRCPDCHCSGVEAGVRGPRKCSRCNGRKFLTVPGPLKGMNEHERSALAAAWWYWQKSQQQKATA